MKICWKKLLDWDITQFTLSWAYGLRGIIISNLWITGEQLMWVADDTSFGLKVFCKVKLSFYELKMY